MSKLPYKAILNSLFAYGKIKTTKARAKSSQGLAEKLISQAKTQTVSARRQLDKFLSHQNAANLFKDAKTVFSSRTSGFTRIVGLGSRLSDAANMVYLELIKDEVKAVEKTKDE